LEDLDIKYPVESVSLLSSVNARLALECAYTAAGQLVSLTDAQSQVTSYTYDDVGNKLSETYPDHVSGATIGQTTYGKILFTYDAIGRTLVRTDQQGDTCTFNYDLGGRLSAKNYVGHASGPLTGVSDADTFTYDASSRMLTAASGRYSNTVAHTYDTAGRKATEALTISGQTYTATTNYDAAGQTTGYSYPSGKSVARTYTSRGQLATLAYDGTVRDTRAYDDGGRMTSSSYSNGVGESRTYNSDNTLAGISFTGASIGNLTYGWDDNKNKTSETITGTMSGYGFTVPTSGYDDEDRLVSYQRTNNTLSQSWNLSLVGDWNSVTTNGTAQSRTHDPTHELLTAATQTVTHDAKGNMTLIPASLRGSSQTPTQPLKMKWDFENKLLAADTNNDNTDDVFYKFDALGLRVARTANSATTIYFQSGQQTIADYASGATASSPTFSYIYASYVDEPVARFDSAGASAFYHRNQQYSITAVSDGGGAVVERYAYSAYGTPTITGGSGSLIATSAISNRYTYTGREWDASLAIYHYRARMYDSVVGRFVSRDPIVINNRTQSLFEYVNSGPTIYLDPSGQIAFAVVPVALIYAAAAATGIGVFACMMRPSCMVLAGEMALAFIDTTVTVISTGLGGYQPLPKEIPPLPKPMVNYPWIIKCPKNLDWPYCGLYEYRDGGVYEREFGHGSARQTSRFTVDDPDGPYEVDCELIEGYPGPCLGW